MSTENYANDPLKSAALVPEDPFTEPPAGPVTTSANLPGAENTESPGISGAGSTAGRDTKDAAKDEARQLGREGVETAKQVGHTAKDEAGKIAQEAKSQVTNLVGELGADLKSQACAQQQKVADGLRSVSDELRSMAENSAGGTASSLVGQAAGKAGDVADWLDGRDPGSLLEEVKGFARRRPGVFLAVAAGAGLVAGRLARGITAPDDTSAEPNGGTARAYTGGAPATYADPAAGVRTPAEPTHAPTDAYPPTNTGVANGFPAGTDPEYPRA